jgi:hypothetical protein
MKAICKQTKEEVEAVPGPCEVSVPVENGPPRITSAGPTEVLVGGRVVTRGQFEVDYDLVKEKKAKPEPKEKGGFMRKRVSTK